MLAIWSPNYPYWESKCRHDTLLQTPTKVDHLTAGSDSRTKELLLGSTVLTIGFLAAEELRGG